ncbi:hypothetical protein AXF42_Ash004580 [Apostasia shenzhenica]|uniref:Transmembrane protein 209 n=1 Tax=Apostasia shenzhenica TaxID=1088818 RepID=A0A2I0BH26_9ASPA|nr:hypothetical protein AXF42_Ash004580 [Apostasia shenzhenica]
MEGRASPAASPKPKFSVYQNPTFSAALTAASLRPSLTTLFLVCLSLLAAAFSLVAITSWEEDIVKSLAGLHFLSVESFLIARVLQAAVGLVFLATLSSLLRTFFLLNSRKVLVASSTVKTTDKQNLLTQRQLKLLGLMTTTTDKIEGVESDNKPSKSTASSKPITEALVPIRKSAFSYSPSRSSRSRPDQQSSSAGKKMIISPKSPSSSATPWSRRSPGNAKGILTEEKLEQFLASVDEKMIDSEVNAALTPSPVVSRFRIGSPGSIPSSTTASGAARSTPLRPVRMSPGSHQKYTTPPKKGEMEFPPPMSMEQAVESFEGLGIYPQIEHWRDCLRQWFSSVVINPLLEKIVTSHIQVVQAAANLGAIITINQVGCDPSNTTVPLNVSPIDGMKEWQPTFTLDEDGFLHQMRASLVQMRDGAMSRSPFAIPPQTQQIALLSLIQQCLDAITEHQRLNTLMKGELIKGLLAQSAVPADYTVHRVRKLAEGTCLKNFDYIRNGNDHEKSDKKWPSDVPTDSHLLLYLFSAFLEHPKWMLHVDPASYSGAHASKNPLFLGVLPPKDRFPEKYVAIISGVPSIIHPGACILSVGKQNSPIFALYWDKKLQFCLQGRTAIWDAILLFLHRIKTSYGAVVRGVHLGSSAFNILPLLESGTELNT